MQSLPNDSYEPYGHSIYAYSAREAFMTYERARANFFSYLLDGSRRAAMRLWQQKVSFGVSTRW